MAYTGIKRNSCKTFVSSRGQSRLIVVSRSEWRGAIGLSEAQGTVQPAYHASWMLQGAYDVIVRCSRPGP